MTMQEFIDAHRGELDELIRKASDPNCEIDDRERELWIANDQGLYDWACSEGVEELLEG